MTIRRQFHILLAAIIVIPICCALFLPAYHYFTSPGRALIHDYKELRKSDTFKLSVRADKSVSNKTDPWWIIAFCLRY